MQYVLVQKLPDVIYVPSTVVNHNGVNMEGEFSSYKWKVPCFPTNTTQRCVRRIMVCGRTLLFLPIRIM